MTQDASNEPDRRFVGPDCQNRGLDGLYIMGGDPDEYLAEEEVSSQIMNEMSRLVVQLINDYALSNRRP